MPRKFSTKLLLIVCVVLLGLFIAWPLSIFQDKTPTVQSHQRHYATHEVSTRPEIEYYKAPGTIEPAVKSELMARVIAHVTHVYVDPGDEVKANALLIQLDSRDTVAKIKQVQEQIKARQAVLTNAKLQVQRLKQLLAKNYVSPAEYDRAEADFLTAQANLEETKKALEAAEVELSYCQIRAPADGRVLETHVEVGDQTVPLKSLLSFQSESTLRLNADVPESLANKLSLAQSLAVTTHQSEDKIAGVVSEIVPNVDPTTRSFEVKVSLTDHPKLYVGSFGRLWIPLQTVEVITIPHRYIERSGQLQVVYLLADKTVQRLFITTGKQFDDGTVEVLSGLTVGDHLILPKDVHAR